MTSRSDIASESGHWYEDSGRPAYTVIGSNGKERPTTLRDARKLGLFPSVTTILAMEAKPQLERWKIEQGLLSALTLPRVAGESDDSFMARALDDSRVQARKAAERGTYLHGVMEKALQTGLVPEPDKPIIAPVVAWLDTNFPSYERIAEHAFANPLGFGGKIDLHGVNAAADSSLTLDFKFKDFNDPEKVLAYAEHCTQLAAYANGLNRPLSRCVNLFISSTVPGLIVPKEWTISELERGWECFKLLLRLYQLRKGYMV